MTIRMLRRKEGYKPEFMATFDYLPMVEPHRLGNAAALVRRREMLEKRAKRYREEYRVAMEKIARLRKSRHLEVRGFVTWLPLRIVLQIDGTSRQNYSAWGMAKATWVHRQRLVTLSDAERYVRRKAEKWR